MSTWEIFGNPRTDVVGCSKESLRLALEIVMLRHNGKERLTHYAEVEPRLEVLGQHEGLRDHTKRLVLFWTKPDRAAQDFGEPNLKCHKFLAAARRSSHRMVEDIWDWLVDQWKALQKARIEYDPHPDVDGKIGFRLWCDEWGHVKASSDECSLHSWQAACQIEFVYALVGK